MEYYWICLRADGTAGLFKTQPSQTVSYEDFEYIKRECGFEWAETVMVYLDDVPYMLLVDEEGKLNNKQINNLATDMYQNPYDVIVGDVAILGCPVGEEMMYIQEQYAIPLFDDIKDVLQKQSR